MQLSPLLLWALRCDETQNRIKVREGHILAWGKIRSMCQSDFEAFIASPWATC